MWILGMMFFVSCSDDDNGCLLYTSDAADD